MIVSVLYTNHVPSRPVWGAWIEIEVSGSEDTLNNVAPRMGRVD